jgi:hypothetical protein
MNRSFCALCLFALLAGPVLADPLLKLPEFDALSEKASEAVTITLDSALLRMAAQFLDAQDPEDAAARKAITGLKGIYVRSFTFDSDFAYPTADVEGVRKQLSSPGWSRLVEVRSRKERARVDIYVSTDGDKANGLAIIASESRQFTIVNIVGAIDLDTLHKLENKFGIPPLELERAKAAPRK